jgi:hypothetical protein
MIVNKYGVILILFVLLLSGCVTATTNVQFNLTNGTLSGAEQIYIRYSNGETATVSGQTGTNIQITTDSSKKIVGAYINDGNINWVPDNYSYSPTSSNMVLVDLNSSQPKPTKPADYAVLQSLPVPDPLHPGYVSVTFAVHSSDGSLVDNQTDVFGHADSSATFYNNDPKDTNVSFRTDYVNEGFASYTKNNGLVTFVIQSNKIDYSDPDFPDISSVPLKLYSGTTKIYDSTKINRLSAISLSSGSISPAFDSETTTYTASVPYSVDSLSVTASVYDSRTAALTVNATSVPSGQASGAINLIVGNNSITITATPLNGTSKTYTVNVTREAAAASSNADLSGLVLSSGALNETFTAATPSYTQSVANSVTSLTVTPSVADSTARVTVNGTTVVSGQPSAVIPLNVGANPITVVVTAENNSTNSYIITVTRAASANANLSGLSLSSGVLNETFATATPSYTQSVANSVTSLTVTPSVADSTARVTVNGTTVVSGQLSAAILLSVGANPITVVVTAEDNSTNSYIVTVTRAANSNAALSSLTIDQGVLSPVFSPLNTDYTASVPNSVSSFNLSLIKAGPDETLSVTGAENSSVSDSVYSYNASLQVGVNRIQITVTAQNGANNMYTVNVTRAAAPVASGNADLSGLVLSSGTLSPVFASGITTYTSNVSNNVYSLTVTTNVYDNRSTMTVNGTIVASGQASSAIGLNVGNNPITIAVTAQNGTTKTYVVTVNRAAKEKSRGGDGGLTTPTNSKVTATDGKLTLPTGKTGEVSLGETVTVAIPADATDKELKITIEKVLDTQKLLTNKNVLASPVYEILKNFPENFSKPVTLTLSFDPTSLMSNQKAAVFYYDEAKKEWVEVAGGTVNGDHITVEVDHFTKFAVFAVDQAANVPTKDSSTDTKPTITFSDISGHWAEANIKQAVSGGIVTGYPDGTYRPGSTVTRAEFAVMLMNVLKPQGNGAELTFSDTAMIGIWAQQPVAQAVQAGIIKGYEDGTFRPDSEITRTEMAAMIANALGVSIEANTATGFSDDKDVPAWAKSAVAAMKKLGLVEGKGTNEFDPNATATRAEAATVLLKVLEQKASKVKTYIKIEVLIL